MNALVDTAPVARVCLKKLIPSPEAVACLTESVARRLMCVPIALCTKKEERREQLIIASPQPHDALLYERLMSQLPSGMSLHFVLADESDIRQALEKCYTDALQGQELLQACSHGVTGIADELTTAARILEAVLLNAHRQRASDVHLSPCDEGVEVRFRIDGVLHKRSILRAGFYTELVGRIKILAKMDIAESRRPQDGQFTQFIDNEQIDLRTSSFPTLNGENIVIRVLRANQAQCGMAALHLPENLHKSLLTCLHKPCGLIVFCGPTGSGKSTSMHALLSELDRDSLNIMTLEDPVEKISPGIQQTNIDSARSFGYADALRALMRQDPDVLLIGEVRDSDSCQMMLRAVMTGHNVLTTVHAQNVFGAIDRVVELGVNLKMFASHLLCIAAQRLMRKTCRQCSGLYPDCTMCRGSGYYGRQAVIELLVVTPKIASLISSAAKHQEIFDEARQAGFVGIQEHAELLVKQGVSTQKELKRVFG